MPVKELLEKAGRLLRSRRVTRLEGNRYNIVGDHGTYLVQVHMNGRLTCSCPGFRGKHICSHVVAVMLMKKKKRRSSTESSVTPRLKSGVSAEVFRETNIS